MSNQYFENNPNINHTEYQLSLYYLGNEIKFLSDNGVFSKKQIDYGSNLLLKNVPNKTFKRVLDVGCGIGIIGLSIAKAHSDSKVDLIDVNLNAIKLTKDNAKLNKIENVNVFESDVYQNVLDKYDLIITNPPIRAGKQVVLKILDGAIEHLEENGALMCVIKTNHGAKSYVKHLKELYKDVTVVDKASDYLIIKAEK